MDFLATAKEVTNWVITEPSGIITSFAYTAGFVVAGVGLGYGARFLKNWYDKTFYKPYQPCPHIKRVKLPSLDSE